MGPKPHWGHGAGNLKKGSKENDTQVVAIPTATKPKKRKKEEKQNVRWIVSTNLCAKAVFSSSKKLKFTRKKKKVKRMPTLPTNGRSSFEHLSFVHVKRRKKLQFRLMKTRKKKNTTLYKGPQPHFSMSNFLTTRSKTMLLFFKAAKTEKYVNRQ